MQKTRLRVKDSEGDLTTYGVFLDCRYDIGKKLKELPTGVTRRKEITWREFSKIIRLYWTYTFERVIEGRLAKLRNGLGTLRVVKTLCTRYTPKKLYKTDNGWEYRSIDVEKYNGYFYFVHYESKKYKRYRIFPVYKIRKEYMNRVDSGEDFLDFTE